jgi:hypothetical protein
VPAVVGFSFMLLSYNIVYFTEREDTSSREQSTER